MFALEESVGFACCVLFCILLENLDVQNNGRRCMERRVAAMEESKVTKDLQQGLEYKGEARRNRLQYFARERRKLSCTVSAGMDGTPLIE